MNKHYCKKCDENVNLETKTTILKGELKGEEITYEGKISYGSECRHEIIGHEIIGLNEKVLNDTYRKHHNILQIDEIRKLTTIYGIGKRPLSLILGWGELTFTRYCDGDIPTSMYANILNEIYQFPELYLKNLESRKDLISQSAYKKSKIKSIELIKSKTNSSHIFSYILHKCVDITEKSIFKLAYYINGFHLAFYGEKIIKEEIMLKDKEPSFINVSIELLKLDDEPTLTVTEKLIADNVIKYIGRYSGNILTSFVESEPPIINASISEEKMINENDIKVYFENVIKKYKMLSPLDIHGFAEDKLK